MLLFTFPTYMTNSQGFFSEKIPFPLPSAELSSNELNFKIYIAVYFLSYTAK